MSSSVLLRVEAADFGHDARSVVRDVHLEIRNGDYVALVGANGAGKTTLLRGLLGLAPPLTGRVVRKEGLRVGYTPQRETLDPLFPLSAFGVALLGTYGDVPSYRPLGARERGRARDALEACPALSFARQRYGELSGGQRQRVLLARALASEPELLLLDEPTAGIDPETQEQILETLSEVRRQRDLAIWIITHQLEAVRRRVDRIAILADGKLGLGGPS